MREILIFALEVWVDTPRIMRYLGGFQHRVVRRITGKHQQQQYNWIWQYPPLEELIWKSALEDMETYIYKR